MLCDDCGHENPSDLQFCESCNSKLGISQIQESAKIREIPQIHEQITYIDKEINLYSDDKGVRITNKRAIFENKTHDLTNVLSISLHVEDSSLKVLIIAIVVGFLLFLLGQWVLGCIIALGGAVYYYYTPVKYSIRMFRSSGETDILSSINKEYIQNIIDKMNERGN